MKINPLFKDHEAKIIVSFLKSLSEESRKIASEQFNSVKVIQRISNGHDVNMYSRGIFKTKPLNCIQFSEMPEELLVAKFKPEDSESSLDMAELWFINGRPFTIEFSGSMKLGDDKNWICEIVHDFK